MANSLDDGGLVRSLARFMQAQSKTSPAVVNGARNFMGSMASQPGGGAGGTVNSIIPDPAVYEGETAQALQAYQSALSNIAQRRSGTLEQYGFTGQVDPNSGQMSNYAIDPNNQYGAIQQLLGTQGNNITSLLHQAAGRGIGHLGLGAQDMNRYRAQAGGEQASLGQQFVGDIGNEASDQFNAGASFNQAKLQAQRDAISSAIQNQMFTPAQMQSIGSAGSTPNLPQVSATAGARVANKPVNPLMLARRFGGGGI